MRIYPNPSNGLVNILLSADSIPAILEIYSIEGMRIFVQAYRNTTNANIDLTGHPTGIYVVKVIADGVCYEEKIVKE